MLPFFGTKLPRCEVVFNIAVHAIPFPWLVAFFEGEVALELVDDVQRMDQHRTDLHAGLAGSAGPELFLCDIIMEQGLAVFL